MLRFLSAQQHIPCATHKHVVPSLRAGLTAALLLITMTACLLAPALVSARSAITGGTAPGGPGATAVWSPSTSSILGTSATTASDVWFTGYNGIISEVYWPTADTPNTTDMQFMIGDSGHSWVDEEKAATTSSVTLYDAHSLAWTVTNTATSGKYKIVKTIYTDPTRNSLIQHVTFTALSGTLANYLLYVLYNPTMHNNGMNNNSSTQTYNGTTMLLSTDSSGNYASALAASVPYQSGMTSSGYVGVNDGWTDLKGTSNCGSSTCPDYTMSDGYSAASNGNTAQMGLLDLSNGGTVNTSTATSLSFNLVLAFGSGATAAEQTLAATLGDTSDLLSTYVAQWNTFDNSLNTPPALGSTTAIQQARQQEYYLAANVVKASQDKQTGAFVAGLGTPWGDTQAVSNDPQGYHVVWERDMYEFASALIVAGDTADPTRAIHWAFNTQQQSDGHFPQNTYVNGTVVWGGIQMDEQAFPIMLAWKLGVTDSSDYTNHILPVATYIVNHGPSTGQERWEENGGYSPATIATEIAGLVCAAAIAMDNGDSTNANLFANTADSWRSQVVNWTYTTTGGLSGGSYFERIDNNGNPNDGATINLANGGGSYDERNVVDSSFLELVRQGIFPASDSHITTSLATIDATIKQTINGHDYFFRYNHDGYGETSSGANYTGAGVGGLWPLLSGERGIYTIAAGGSGDAALSAMLASANSSGFIPEQIWANPAPSGYTAGTPSKSMTPLNWAMGEYITLLFSASQNCIADVAAIVYDRYAGTTSCGGSTGGGSGGTPPAGVSISPNPALAGQAATITYNGTLAASASSVTMHWGYNSWTSTTNTAMTKQSDGTWQATITVPSGATTLNTAFYNQSSTWDNNGGSNYNFSVTTATVTPTPTSTPTATSTPTPTPTSTPAGGTTCTVGSVSSATCPLVAGASGTIVYSGSLASSASSLTLHWGYNNWTGTTDTAMTKQSNGTWTASITVPTGATVINTAFKNQSGTWDNNSSSNYNLPVGSCFVKVVSTTSCPTIPGTSITIVYAGSLAASASSLTLHWGYNNWTGTTDVTMTKQSNGTWTATITVPSGATTLNMAFKNQSGTWDNNSSSNYNLNT